MILIEEDVIKMFGGEDSKKILSAKTIAQRFNTTKRKCHAFLYRNKKFIKVKNPAVVGSGTHRSSLWTLQNDVDHELSD